MKNRIYYRIISSFISLIMAAAMIVIIYATFSVDNKSVLGYRLFIVSTGSMKQFINQGDLIIVKNVPFEKLSVNDVITFVSSDPDIEGKINTHRIIRIENLKIYTKGDANTNEDLTPVTQEKIIGKLILKSSFTGSLIRTLSKPFNMIFFIVIPIILMSVSDFIIAKKKIKDSFKGQEE